MDSDAADKAIAQFNGTDFNGRALTVNEARPMVKKEGFSNRNYR
jgi:RNA recognition motif-containing protein